MTSYKPLLYAAFFTGMAACTGNAAKAPVNAPAQQVNQANTDRVATFKWETELCENTGNYNPDKYSEKQLQNTYELWFRLSAYQLEHAQPVFEPEDLVTLDLKKLVDEYEIKKTRIEQMKVVDLPYWRTLKEQRIKELNDQYELAKLLIQAYSDPAVLLKNRFAGPCRLYADALTSPDTTVLLATWKAFTEEQKAKNGAPEDYMNRFYKKFNSPLKLTYAKIDLISFAWSNCANDQVNHVNNDGSMQAEFEKLFTNVKEKCDEP